MDLYYAESFVISTALSALNNLQIIQFKEFPKTVGTECFVCVCMIFVSHIVLPSLLCLGLTDVLHCCRIKMVINMRQVNCPMLAYRCAPTIAGLCPTRRSTSSNLILWWMIRFQRLAANQSLSRPDSGRWPSRSHLFFHLIAPSSILMDTTTSPTAGRCASPPAPRTRQFSNEKKYQRI